MVGKEDEQWAPEPTTTASLLSLPPDVLFSVADRDWEKVSACTEKERHSVPPGRGLSLLFVSSENKPFCLKAGKGMHALG